MRDGFVKVAAAVPQVRVADPLHNAREVRRLMDEAEAQGVQPGNILVSVDGEQVSEVSQLSEIIDAKEVGGYVTLELYRYGGDMAYLNVTLMETADLY